MEETPRLIFGKSQARNCAAMPKIGTDRL